MFDTNTVMMQEKEIYYQEDGEILFAVAPKKTITPAIVFVMNEIDMMDADLDMARKDKRITCLTDKNLEEIDSEQIGANFCEQPYLY